MSRKILLWASVVIAVMSCAWGAIAKDDGQYGDVPSNVREWFENLKNSQGGSCCSLADGHRLDGDDVDTKGDKWLVQIDGKWYEIPADRVVTNSGNPTGQAVVFYDTVTNDAGKTVRIYCFVPGGGA